MFTIKQSYALTDVCDALVVGLFDDEKKWGGPLKAIDDQLDGQLTELRHEGDISGKANKVAKVYPLGKLGAKRLYVVGLGKKESFNLMKARAAFGVVTKVLCAAKLENIAVLFETFLVDHLEVSDVACAFGEAVTLASYQIVDYKQKGTEPDKKIKTVTVYFDNEEVSLLEGLEMGQIFGEGTNHARTLVNTPGNLLNPSDLADYAVQLAKRYGMEYEILEKEDMMRLGMGGLLAVNQGSDQPPKMIVLKYRGKEKWDDVLSFVGKGITFDAGGISLKPAKGMEDMKSDMGGAAAVLGAMEVIGRLKPSVNVLAVIPSTENLINGSAIKPGDVITALSGKTIEVKNTDAEGRLILADGVAYAKQLGANYIVDLATLTGAVIVALGECTTGAITNNEDFFEDVLESAMESGEYMWRLPNFKPYYELLKTSDVADLNNSPGREAGSITAGLFVGEHVGDTPWVHLDIAGTAYVSKAHELGPKGATGAMVRTLARLTDRLAD